MATKKTQAKKSSRRASAAKKTSPLQQQLLAVQNELRALKHKLALMEPAPYTELKVEKQNGALINKAVENHRQDKEFEKQVERISSLTELQMNLSRVSVQIERINQTMNSLSTKIAINYNGRDRLAAHIDACVKAGGVVGITDGPSVVINDFDGVDPNHTTSRLAEYSQCAADFIETCVLLIQEAVL